MKSFKHSGAMGDLIYGLALVQEFGGGDFYLHLNQLDWVGRHYYGSAPSAFHQGRMTQADFEFMKTFMEFQPYIAKFAQLDPKVDAITHNLDRFRQLFVGHPTNYLDVYNATFGVSGQGRERVLSRPWLSVPQLTRVPHRPVVVNRTDRWTPPVLSDQWRLWREQGLDQKALFVGLPAEYSEFVRVTGWQDTIYHPTPSLLELAEIIAGAQQFIGNQSQCYALAVGLGVPQICLEMRQDLPRERNECYFPSRPQITYI